MQQGGEGAVVLPATMEEQDRMLWFTRVFVELKILTRLIDQGAAIKNGYNAKNHVVGYDKWFKITFTK